MVKECGGGGKVKVFGCRLTCRWCVCKLSDNDSWFGFGCGYKGVIGVLLCLAHEERRIFKT